MGQQELRVFHQPLEPFFLKMLRRDVAQQHRDLPVLHELVGQSRIAAGNFFGDQREGLHLGLRIKLHPAEFLGYAQRADADAFGALEDFLRQPVFRRHQPFVLPVRAHERDDDVVNERAAAIAHHALFFGEVGHYAGFFVFKNSSIRPSAFRMFYAELA